MLSPRSVRRYCHGVDDSVLFASTRRAVSDESPLYVRLYTLAEVAPDAFRDRLSPLDNVRLPACNRLDEISQGRLLD